MNSEWMKRLGAPRAWIIVAVLVVVGIVLLLRL